MTAIRAVSSTPNGVSIESRQPTFDLEQVLATDWLDNDPFITAVFNAMSISFPSGEREFIQSVRYYEEQVSDEKLKQEVNGFYKQEATHSREHRKYNKMLCRQRGYDLDALESIYQRRIDKARDNPKISPIMLLASTIAAEHFTASMAAIVLEGDMLEKAEPSVKELWLWHAMEELEHKAVAYDVYTQLKGEYKLRIWMMRFTMLFYLIDTLRVVGKMLRHDKQFWTLKTLKSFGHFMFAKKGFVRQFVPAYKDFFRKDFHPWDVDNRALLTHWQQALSPA